MSLMSHPINTFNGGVIGGTLYLGSGGGVMDEPNTINPASLNTGHVLPNPFPNNASQQSPRNLKRSRSPEGFVIATGEGGDEGESKPRKRGRPSKSKNSSSPQAVNQTAVQPIPAPVQTPQTQSRPLPQTSPSQTSPLPRPTPTKQTVIKALPTVRDHTTDQLNPEGDEYIPREFDEEGEKKVTPYGHILGGREYRCRTFYVPNRGNKLFMLATECARVLGYRDSYLLFNKNRSLYKIIASQAEKDDLIQQEILLYSYRSRQIAIVTARSMFRQFGSRLIVNGRRVRDDYWEGKARKQGFTEEDAAGEKRPGAAKQREAAAAEASNAQAQSAVPSSEIMYINRPGGPLDMQPGVGSLNQASIAPLPMIGLTPNHPTDDMLRQRDYGNVPRPRQEISGAPYQDRSVPSAAPEILNQATHTIPYSKVVNRQRNTRGQYLEEHWKRPHESQIMHTQRQGTSEVEGMSLLQQHQQQQPHQTNQQQHQPQPQHPGLQSPHNSAPGPGVAPLQQHSMLPHQQQGVQQFSLTAPLHSYQSQAQAHTPRKGMAQSPVRSSSFQHQQPLRPEQQPSFDRSPSMGLGSGASHGQAIPAITTATSTYGYPTTPMWPPPLNHYHQHQSSPQQQQQHHHPQPHPSPLSQSHPSLQPQQHQHQQQQHQQYGRQQSPLQQQQQQHSPLPVHHQSPLHGGASHLRGQPSAQHMPGSVNANASAAAAAAMGYSGMTAVPGSMTGLSSPAAVMGGYPVSATGTPIGRNPYQAGQSPVQTAMGHPQQHPQHQPHPHHQHQQHPGPSMSPMGQHHPQHHPQHQHHSQQAGGMQGWVPGPGQAGAGNQGPQGGWMGY